MNIRTRFVFALALLLLPAATYAHEGMWTPEDLPLIGKELKKAGLTVSVEKLANLATGPLSAVINLNGCTASFISSEGLVITNHHCAVSAIQRNSTEGINRIEQGFTARSKSDELWAGPSSRIRVTVAQTDETPAFAQAVSEAKDDAAAFAAVDALEKSLIAACEKEAGYRCQVARYDGGARYVLIKQLDIRDVRLVHAPPRAIGVFGGDEDNWMWPRHTGDWTLFRAYVGKDGMPADHAKENVPYRPKRHLTVNAKGVSAGDFVMVAGYPGRTYRWRTAGELKHSGEHYYPRTMGLLNRLVSLIESEQKTSEEARVKLTGKRGWIANYAKYIAGLLDGFEWSGVIARRATTEEALKGWMGSSKTLIAKYGRHVAELDRVLAARNKTQRRDGLLSWIRRLPTAMNAASKLHWLAYQRQFPDAEREQGYQERDVRLIQARMDQSFRSWHAPSDAAILKFLLKEANQLPGDARIEPLDAFIKAHGGIEKTVTWLYESPELTRPEARKALIGADLATVEKSGDRFMALIKALHADRVAARDRKIAFDGAMIRLRPAYMAALREHSGRQLYSDANSTLRVTYDRVRGYSPREAITYDPFTTLKGILEKDTGKEPFDVPPAQRQAIEAFHKSPVQAPYMRDGTVPVNFLSGCDTTGGNSGSPTLDSQGRLVGLLFDGNYEAMSSDWVFDTDKTRSIHVDIRYVLWALDRLFKADHILQEMTIQPEIR